MSHVVAVIQLLGGKPRVRIVVGIHRRLADFMIRCRRIIVVKVVKLITSAIVVTTAAVYEFTCELFCDMIVWLIKG